MVNKAEDEDQDHTTQDQDQDQDQEMETMIETKVDDTSLPLLSQHIGISAVTK